MPVSLLVRAVTHALRISSSVAFDLVRLAFLTVRSDSSLGCGESFSAQTAGALPGAQGEADDATRWMMATLGRMFPWRNALVNVKPNTLIRWQRRGFRLFWRWQSKPPGRPRLPKHLRELIRQM